MNTFTVNDAVDVIAGPHKGESGEVCDIAPVVAASGIPGWIRVKLDRKMDTRVYVSVSDLRPRV